ncbi:HEAT repeat domain-containing protein [Actinomadura sp. 9N407]|uniref:HEAT repeat domain-containing protein n=1 Tax=Actinomadura sp. 9N407 TaxID=3375154 RepID=UPI00379089DD
MSLRPRSRTPDSSEADAQVSVTGVGIRDEEGAHRLAGLLLRPATEESAPTLLRLVGERPDLLIALDRLARHPLYAPVPGWSEEARRAFAGGSGGIAVTALASLHRNGHVRETATAALDAEGVLLPFLMLRTTDHVPQVRDQARAALATALFRHPEAAGRLAALALRLVRRGHGGFALAQVTAVLWNASANDLRASLTAARGHRTRRFLFDLALAAGALDPVHLRDLALADPDWRLRAKAADLLAKDAVWTRRPDLLRELVPAAAPEVRVSALTGLDRLGLLGPAVRHLTDGSFTVRAFARDACRRAGDDPAAHYRALVDSATPPAPGALAGLGECGSSGDVPRLARWLDHPSPAGRVQAVRALDRLGGVRLTDRASDLLTDTSADVIREAARALRPLAGRLGDDRMLALLAHDRHQVRYAAYSILRERDGWLRLRAALTSAVDAHLKTATRARIDAVWWARRDEPAHVPPRDWQKISRERLPALTWDEHAVLTALADAATPFLSPYAVGKLHRLLHTHRTSQ